MNEEYPASDSSEEIAPRQNHNRICELCGRFDSMEIADRHLCVDCYGTCGSGCSG